MFAPPELEGRARQKWLWYRQMNANGRGEWVWKLEAAGRCRRSLAEAKRIHGEMTPEVWQRTDHREKLNEVRALPPAPLPR